MVGTFVLWRHARDAQDVIAGVVTESEAGRVREELARALDARAAALDGVAHAVIEQGEAHWPVLASRLLDRDPGWRSLATLDTAMALDDVRPETATLGPWLAPQDSVARIVALRAALQSAGSGAAVAATAPLANGEPELVVGTIVPHAGAGPTYLVGVLRARDLLDAVLQRTIRHGFQVAVFDGGNRIFGADEEGAGMEVARDTAVQRDAILWRLVVWPADEQMGRYDSWASQAVLGLGMLLAFTASLVVFLWRRVVELERESTSDS